MKFRLLLALMSIALVQCSMVDDVTETKNISKDLKRETEKLGTLTEEFVYKGIKAGTNKEVRDIFKDLDAAENDGDRLYYATLWYSSFEFQQWHGLYSAGAAMKEDLNAKAMRIFFVKIEALTNRNLFVGGDAPVTAHWKKLGALGAAMDEIDPDQVKAAKRRSLGAVSVYELILEGLKYKGLQARGEAIPEFARLVLEHEEEAVYMLQMRHNFYAAMMVSEFSDVNRTIFSAANLENIPKDTWKWLKGIWYGPTIEVNNATFEKIAEKGVKWLGKVVETQTRLKELGYPLEFNKFVSRLFVLSRIKYEENERDLFKTPQMVAVQSMMYHLKELMLLGRAYVPHDLIEGGGVIEHKAPLEWLRSR